MASERSNSDDKVYQFVSDPGHKETLSGRVRAACVNCRRKKMKCSGVIPCETCTEKCVACEGFTARKKPSRNAPRSRTRTEDDAAGNFGRSDGTTPQTAQERHERLQSQVGSADRPARRPVALTQLRTDSGNNFGYATNTNTGSTGELGYTPRSRHNSYHLSPSTSSYYDSAPTSPTTYQAHEFTGLNRRVSEIAESATSSASSNQTRSSQLLDAARALEEQAQTLRRLALHKGADLEESIAQQTTVPPVIPGPVLQAGYFAPCPEGTYDAASLQLGSFSANGNFGQAMEEYSVWQGPNATVSTMPNFEQSASSSRQNSVYMAPPSTDPLPAGHWQAWQNLAQSMPSAGAQIQWQSVTQTTRDRQASQSELPGSFANQQPDTFGGSFPWKFDGT